MKNLYFVKFNTGAGDFEFTGTLETVMLEADKGVAYTQRDVSIENENGKLVAFRRWWGIAFNPDETEEEESEIIEFGSFGYYGAWELC
jgi:hypothetical protein